MIRDDQITVFFESTVHEIGQTSVKLRKDKKIFSIPNAYVFIFAGGEPPFPLMNKIGLRFGGELESAD